MEVFRILGEFKKNYDKETPQLLKIIDVFLVYQFLTGVLQFVYCVLVGTFPFNSFLSGFISTVGSFILTGKVSFTHKMLTRLQVCLRIQVSSPGTFRNISKERAFFDYLIANLILHLWVMNFMG